VGFRRSMKEARRPGRLARLRSVARFLWRQCTLLPALGQSAIDLSSAEKSSSGERTQ
jgi:hypothetical protein